jgi:hypothetical protein
MERIVVLIVSFLISSSLGYTEETAVNTSSGSVLTDSESVPGRKPNIVVSSETQQQVQGENYISTLPSKTPAFSKELCDIYSLIRRGLNKNFKMIQEKSKLLTDSEKLQLYNMNKKCATLPCIYNGIFGFGIGSFSQGDINGGLTALVIEGVGAAIYIGGLLNYKYWSSSSVSLVLICSGYTIFVAGRIFGLIRPLGYTKKYNIKLQDALGYKTITINISPFISPSNNNEVFYGAEMSIIY